MKIKFGCASVKAWIAAPPVWLEIHDTTGLPLVSGLDEGETAAIALAEILPHVRWGRWLAARGSVLFQIQPPLPAGEARRWRWQPYLFPVSLVLTAALLQIANIRAPLLGRGGVELDRAYWPMDLLPELRRHERDHRDGTPIFNDMLFGGFLIYHTPGYRVFIDDRCELFGDEFLTHYVQAKAWLELGLYDHPSEPFAEWQVKYGAFDLALVQTGEAFDVALSQLPAWEVVRRTETATLYKKADGLKPE